jgi:hypothetical protein
LLLLLPLSVTFGIYPYSSSILAKRECGAVAAGNDSFSLLTILKPSTTTANSQDYKKVRRRLWEEKAM